MRTADLDEAKDCLIEIVKKGEEPKNDPSEKVRLAFLLDQYMDEHTPKRKSGKAIDIRIAHIAEFYGGCLVSEITKKKQWEFMRQLRERHKHAASYIAMIQKALSASLNYAKKEGRLVSFPHIITGANEIADELDIAPPMPRNRVLSMEEMAMLLNRVKTEHIFRFLIISINTLARPEAVCDLSQSQCIRAFNIINLNPPGRRQTHKFRPIVPMTNTMKVWLDHWGGDRILTWRKGSKKSGKQTQEPIKCVKKAVKRLATTVGFNDVSQYTLRHTMATYLRSKKVVKWEAEGFMGHAGGSQTDGYAHYDPNFLSDARIALDEYMVELQKLVKRPLRPDA